MSGETGLVIDGKEEFFGGVGCFLVSGEDIVSDESWQGDQCVKVGVCRQWKVEVYGYLVRSTYGLIQEKFKVKFQDKDCPTFKKGGNKNGVGQKGIKQAVIDLLHIFFLSF
ncbi:hypothetical protein AgCh_024299 [Apium graveolens]